MLHAGPAVMKCQGQVQCSCCWPMISLLHGCWLMTLSGSCLQEQWVRELTSQGRPVPLRLAHPVPAQMLPAAQLSQHPERLSPGTCSHSETPAYTTHTNHRSVHWLKLRNTALQPVCTCTQPHAHLAIHTPCSIGQNSASEVTFSTCLVVSSDFIIPVVNAIWPSLCLSCASLS